MLGRIMQWAMTIFINGLPMYMRDISHQEWSKMMNNLLMTFILSVGLALYVRRRSARRLFAMIVWKITYSMAQPYRTPMKNAIEFGTIRISIGSWRWSSPSNTNHSPHQNTGARARITHNGWLISRRNNRTERIEQKIWDRQRRLVVRLPRPSKRPKRRHFYIMSHLANGKDKNRKKGCFKDRGIAKNC